MQTASQAMAFEPMELGEKLSFLACYSRYIIALQSEHQEQQALELYNASSEVCEVIVMAGSELPVRATDQYSELAAAFGLATDRHPDAVLAEFVDTQMVRPLVILTGCDQMTDEQLVNAYALADRTGIGLTLFSKVSLKTRRASRNAGHVLHTTVRKLNSRDVKQLLRRKVRDDVQVSEQDIQSVIDRSKGNVDKADAILSEIVSTERKNLGLPLAHMSMVILFLVVAVGGFVFIPESSTVEIQADLQPKVTGESLNRVSTKREDRFASLTDVEPEKVEVAAPKSHTMVTDPVVEEEVVSEPIPEVAETPIVDTSVIEKSGPIQIATADPNAWINSLPATASGGGQVISSSQRDWLASAPGSAYTLQIIGSHDESRIVAFMEQYPALEEFGYFETSHRNQPWFVLTYGRYDDRDAAVLAINDLILPLREQKPWARGVASIR